MKDSIKIVKTPLAYLIVISLGFLSLNVIGCKDIPVGIADSSIIPDDRFTATSYYTSKYAPKKARLNGAGYGWGPRTATDPNDHLQIDLGHVFVICAVATQGNNEVNEWTEQYKISTSVDNSAWNTFKTGNTDKLFAGNTDRNTAVKHVLAVPTLGRFIRFIPTRYHNWKVLRVEVYGVKKVLPCRSLPVGISDGKIPDSDMTSSSSYNSTTSPSKARLNYTAGSSWCAATSDSSPYLQINLRSPYIICGIATQGDHMTDQWVQSYQMHTSNDGTAFTKYMENSQIKSFTGNFDSSTVVKNLLYEGTVSHYIRVVPTSHYGTTNCIRTELYGIKEDGDCTSRAVGLSYPTIIRDHRFTASSYYDEARYRPNFARLLTSNKAWGPKTNSGGNWLQIDLGVVVYVCAVATQGSGAMYNEYITRYKIRVSLDNVNWNYYQENNIEKEFSGNADRYSVVIRNLTNPVKAKFIRFYPIAYRLWPTMRVEVYGIASACSSPLGLEVPGVIQNHQMTSSSHFDNTHTASHGRLYGNSSWCSNTSSNTEYIQINLGQVMTVTGIATQGDHTMDKWVETYTISYSMDENLWNTYKAASNNDKVFQGNSDKESIVVRWLNHPLTARHVRVTPQTWNTFICMRLELYGCDYPTRPVISGLTNQNLTTTANSYVDLVCIVQEPLIQYIKWYTNNTDITSQSTGLVHGGANGLKSTLRVNYTSADNVLDTYHCKKTACNKLFVCRAMYTNIKTNADGIKSAGVTVKLGYPTRLAEPTIADADISSTSVTVRWVKLGSGSSAQATVNSYELEYSNSTHTKTINIPSSQDSSISISGLAIFTNYYVKIRAVSRVGPGQWSPTKQFRTDSALPVSSPNSVTANAPTSQSIKVTWQAPSSGINGRLLGYKVACLSGSDTHRKTTDAQQTTFTFTGLRKWTVYRISVKCYNDKGDGPESPGVTVRTLEDAPDKPESFTVTVLSSTGVRLDLALPLVRNGIIRGFKLHYGKTGSASTEKTFPGNTTLSYILDGLNKCTQYSFKILAYTIKDGPYTPLIQKRTAVDAPSAPSNLQSRVIPPNGPSVPQVTLSWDKPLVCGDDVVRYKVSYSHSEDSAIKLANVDQPKLTVTMQVWGGMTYWFRVSGVTNKEGPYSSRNEIVIPVYAPSVSPSNIAFGDVNKTTFKVSWDQIPRNKSNGPIITYEVSQTLVRRRQKAKRSVDGTTVQVKQMNSSCCGLYLYNLLVCAEYDISVKGYTSAGAGPASAKSLETSAPGPPSGLSVLSVKKKEISLQWKKTETVTEKIESYTILFEGKKDYNGSFSHIGSMSVSSEEKQVTQLYPGTRYEFRVFATTACGKGDNSLPTSITTEVDAPPAPDVGFVSNITGKVNKIQLWQSSDINGEIKAYQVIVVKADDPSSFNKTKLQNYEKAELEELPYYITAEVNASYGKKFPKSFTLGDEKEYNGYKNVKLGELENYHVLQRALTQDGKKVYLPGPSSLIAEGKVLESKEPCTPGKQSQTNTTCISSSAFAVSLAFNVAFLIFLVLLVVYVVKLKKQLEETKNAEKRSTKASSQVVYENTNANKSEGLAMTTIPAPQASSIYEKVDSRGTVGPSDVQTNVTDHGTIPGDKGYYEAINADTKQQMYETVQPTPKQYEKPEASSPQSSTYQSLVDNRPNPVYQSLHTYANKKVKRDGDYNI